MNREIKLRAWNQDNQEFQYFVFFNGGHWSHNIEAHSTNAIKEWQQYTELKDKNSKDIYEGDIVNFAEKKKICPDCAKKDYTSNIEYGISKFCPDCGKELIDSDFITMSKVVFDKGGFAYEWSNERSYFQSWKTYAAEIYLAWVEVIGNIYENTELLKQ